MSWVADLLLSVEVFEDQRLVEDFDRWLKEDAPCRNIPGATGVGSLRPLHDHPEAWGGPSSTRPSPSSVRTTTSHWNGSCEHLAQEPATRVVGRMTEASASSGARCRSSQRGNQHRAVGPRLHQALVESGQERIGSPRGQGDEVRIGHLPVAAHVA